MSEDSQSERGTRPRLKESPRKAGRALSPRREPPKAPAVQVHAHLGGAAVATENTMAAFRGADDDLSRPALQGKPGSPTRGKPGVAGTGLVRASDRL